MKRPNFFCVGAQKAGTSTLHEILKNHPQIYLPEGKETHFFNKDKNYSKGFDWYLNTYYSDISNEKAIGEIAPNYMYIEQVAQRIYNDIGSDIKLIFIFRNPADRAYSNYLMNIKHKREKKSFKKAIAEDQKRLANKAKYLPVFHYLNRGFYDVQVKRLLKYFSKENMMFLIFEEDIIINREKTINNILNFLEVDQIELNTSIKANPAAKLRSRWFYNILNTRNLFTVIGKVLIPNKTARENVRNYFVKSNLKKYGSKNELDELRGFLIDDIYKQGILNLEKIIDKDLSCWYNYNDKQ